MSKVVVITGASSGIGESTAKVLAEQGNKIVLAARREEKLQSIVKDIEDAGGEAIYVLTDVSKMDEVLDLAKKAVDTYGRIDVWINCAGLMPMAELIKGKTDEWEAMVDINLKGTIYGVHAALPIMREQKSGHIINIGSVASYITTPSNAVYCATKFGVRALSDTLRQEEAAAGSNIRVTLIAPGAIDTELTEHTSDSETSAGVKEFYANTAIPPKSVADSIAFAINMPEHTGINEIIIRPINQVG